MQFCSMNEPCLILIDVQNGLDEYEYYGGRRNNLDAEENMSILLHHWRQEKRHVIHVKHNSTAKDSPLRAGQSGNDIKESVFPLDSEMIFEKSVNSAFIGTDLEQVLKQQNIDKLVIIGLTTEHCVSTTTRTAGNLGFEVILVSDATAAFDRKLNDGSVIRAEDVHRTELALLDREFCKVMTTKDVIDGNF